MFCMGKNIFLSKDCSTDNGLQNFKNLLQFRCSAEVVFTSRLDQRRRLREAAAPLHVLGARAQRAGELRQRRVRLQVGARRVRVGVPM